MCFLGATPTSQKPSSLHNYQHSHVIHRWIFMLDKTNRKILNLQHGGEVSSLNKQALISHHLNSTSKRAPS